MTRATVAAAAVGVAAFAAGVGAVVDPAVGGLIPVTTALAVAGNDYLLVVPFAAAGLIACLGAVGVLAARGVREATPPAPEGVPVGVPPGRNLDRLLAGRRAVTARFDPAVRRRAHGRLRDAALETVARAEGCTRAAAADRVEAGSWTDDPVAAAFVRSPPARWTELPGLLRGRSRFQRGASRTVAALLALAEEST